MRTLGIEWTPEMSSLSRIQHVARINLFKRDGLQDRRYRGRTAMLIGLIGFEALCALARRRKKLRNAMYGIDRAAFPEFAPWLIYVIAVHLYYIFVQGHFSSLWYFLHSSLVFAIYAAYWISKLLVRVPERALAVASMLLIALLVARDSDLPRPNSGPTRPSRFAYEFALWTNHNLDPSTRIGNYNSGVVSCFSHCSITNLDGLINNNAGQAILEHRLGQYVENEDLDYLADFGGSIRWSNVYAQNNYVKRLYVAVANFGNPTSWTEGGDYVVLKRIEIDPEAVALHDGTP